MKHTLSHLRSAAGLSAQQVALRAGLSRRSVELIEQGLVPNPGIRTVEQLAKALDTDFLAMVDAIKQSIRKRIAA